MVSPLATLGIVHLCLRILGFPVVGTRTDIVSTLSAMVLVQSHFCVVGLCSDFRSTFNCVLLTVSTLCHVQSVSTTLQPPLFIYILRFFASIQHRLCNRIFMHMVRVAGIQCSSLLCSSSRYSSYISSCQTLSLCLTNPPRLAAFLLFSGYDLQSSPLLRSMLEGLKVV